MLRSLNHPRIPRYLDTFETPEGYLKGANLEGADLGDAKLWFANLEGASLEGAIMPDGTKHK